MPRSAPELAMSALAHAHDERSKPSDDVLEQPTLYTFFSFRPKRWIFPKVTCRATRDIARITWTI